MDMFKTLARSLLAAALLSAGSAALAGDFAVIVNKGNGAAVDKAAVARIYTGEMKAWSDGTPVVAVDLPDDNGTRASFCTEVVGKTVANLRAMWAQIIFSGKAMPPKQAASDEDVKKLVSSTKGAVGYIKASSVDDSVKVAFK